MAHPSLHRRAALAGLAATSFAGSSGLAATRRERRYIDVHNHYAAPAFLEFNRRFVPGSGPLPWDIGSALRDMDEAGVAMSVLSGFTPSIGGTAEDRARLARETNEYGARLVQDHPHRLALFATLPIPDIAACLKEAVYAMDTLGAVGFTVYTDAGDKWLGDPIFAELYAELDRRGAVVFVHPHSPVCCTNVVPNFPDTIIEYGTATSRTIASLIFSGATQRYPRIRFIFSHGGGTVPFLIERFLGNAEVEIVPGIVTQGLKGNLKQPPGTALAELRKLYYDTAQIANPVALRALRDVVGVSQILYGTDAWFRTQKQTVSALESSRIFNAAQLRQVGWENARRLIPALTKA
jgi:predicted TIM-barrel fold metal-dependent hydrolase